MSISTTGWIVIAVAAVLVIAALVVGVSRAMRQRRVRHAEQIREQARLETAKLERREALADETAAKARAAQAEAEVKAAEAARLQERAAKHQSEAATSREQLQEQWNRAESIDPETAKQTRKAGETGDVGEPTPSPTPSGGQAWGNESYEPAVSYGDAKHHRGAST